MGIAVTTCGGTIIITWITIIVNRCIRPTAPYPFLVNNLDQPESF
jgi:hypothetical protein